MAGLPNFATYFGRDMMMTALMMRPVWSPEMSEHVIASVVRKLGPDGAVSHEEALGGQAIRENAVVYDSLVTAYLGRRAGGSAASAADSLLLARARGAGEPPGHPRELPHDRRRAPASHTRPPGTSPTRALPAERKRAFLLDTTDGGEPRIARHAAGAGPGGGGDAGLRGGSPGAQPGRLSPARLGPPPFRELARQRCRICRRPVRDGRERHLGPAGAGGRSGRSSRPSTRSAWGAIRLDSLTADIAGTPLAGYIRDPGSLRRAIETWRGARRHFEVTLGPREIRERLRGEAGLAPPGRAALLGEGPRLRRRAQGLARLPGPLARRERAGRFPSSTPTRRPGSSSKTSPRGCWTGG